MGEICYICYRKERAPVIGLNDPRILARIPSLAFFPILGGDRFLAVATDRTGVWVLNIGGWLSINQFQSRLLDCHRFRRLTQRYRCHWQYCCHRSNHWRLTHIWLLRLGNRPRSHSPDRRASAGHLSVVPFVRHLWLVVLKVWQVCDKFAVKLNCGFV